MCLDRLFLSEVLATGSGCTVLANREGWQVGGHLEPQEAPDNS